MSSAAAPPRAGEVFAALDALMGARAAEGEEAGSEPSSDEAEGPLPSARKRKRGVCFAMAQTGRCRFGDRCAFEHPPPRDRSKDACYSLEGVADGEQKSALLDALRAADAANAARKPSPDGRKPQFIPRKRAGGGGGARAAQGRPVALGELEGDGEEEAAAEVAGAATFRRRRGVGARRPRAAPL